MPRTVSPTGGSWLHRVIATRNKTLVNAAFVCLQLVALVEKSNATPSSIITAASAAALTTADLPAVATTAGLTAASTTAGITADTASSTTPDNHVIYVITGGNLTLPCGGAADNQSQAGNTTRSQIEWILPGRANGSGNLILEQSGSLFIHNMTSEATGTYTCRRDNREYSTVVSLTELPERVVNLTVSAHAHYATVSWCLGGGDGNVGDQHSVSGFLCQYRNDTSQFKQVEVSDLVFRNTSHAHGPASRTCDLYNLAPNNSYFVRIAAHNAAGVGPFVSAVFRTQPDSSLIDSRTRPLVVGLMAGCAVVIFVSTGAISLLLKHRKYTNLQPTSSLGECWSEETDLSVSRQSSLSSNNPNITLNPAFNIEMLEHLDTSENACLMGEEDSNSLRHPPPSSR